MVPSRWRVSDDGTAGRQFDFSASLRSASSS